MATKECLTKFFFHPSLFYLFLDPGSGMGKNQDPGSGINIPDPQHWCRQGSRRSTLSHICCRYLYVRYPVCDVAEFKFLLCHDFVDLYIHINTYLSAMWQVVDNLLVAGWAFGFDCQSVPTYRLSFILDGCWLLCVGCRSSFVESRLPIAVVDFYLFQIAVGLFFSIRRGLKMLFCRLKIAEKYNCITVEGFWRGWSGACLRGQCQDPAGEILNCVFYSILYMFLANSKLR